MTYHNPVLLKESVDGLSIKPEGIYVDVTFGGGGHSKLILSRLKSGKLLAFDQDKSANLYNIDNSEFTFINANFRYVKYFLRMHGVIKIDGLLADLGVSSHQFDVAERGFSIRFDGKLDMRMDTNSRLSAKDVVNDYTEMELANVFYRYGELRKSRLIANRIVGARRIANIKTTAELIDVIGDLSLEKFRNKFLARVFQAIRIEVNDEIIALEEMLLSAVELLKPAGRLAVISYHSLEDRLVKNLMKKGNFSGRVEKDFFGNSKRNLKEINSKVIVASSDEIKLNSRARSAKLRIAEKIYEN